MNPGSNTPIRHHATTKAWDWLENGEGRDRLEADREFIARLLEEMDELLLELDAVNAPLPVEIET